MKPKHILSIDLETYSSIDIGDAGAHKYCESPDFEVLLFGYSVDYGPVRVIDTADGESIPQEIIEMLTDPSVLKTAYNAAFERTALAKYITKEMDPSQWSCSMVLAAQAGLPLKLESCCEALGLPPDEAKIDGRNLIRYFCTPCKPTLSNFGRTRNYPWDDYTKWERFKEYNKRDVEVENTIRRKLERLTPSEEEQRFWQLDQKINDTGVRLDTKLIANAIRMNELNTESLVAEAQELTGLDNVNSTLQVKEWLQKTEGTSIDSLNKKAMPEVLSGLKTDDAKKFLELRSEFSKSSTAKYVKMQSCMCEDEHARGLFQFYGAGRTGRFSGRLIQLQNLPQNHIEDIADVREQVKAGRLDEVRKKHPNVNSTLSELIRTAIIPEPGCHFIVADFSAIEARVISHLANQEWRLEVFRNGGDIYCASASQIFKVPVEKNGVNGHLRQRGKVAELALGYGGGINAMRTMDTARALVSEPDSAIQEIVNGWRDASPNIVALWKSLERAAMKAIRTQSSTRDSIAGIRFDYEDKNLYMVLPSGRRIAYVNAQIGTNRFGSPSILYSGQNQITKKWCTLETYGGKLSENLVQATARDCLREAMMRLDKNGFSIRAHVHDEVIINEPNGSGRTLEDVIRLMCEVPSWAEGLPLNAAGFEADFYMKD